MSNFLNYKLSSELKEIGFNQITRFGNEASLYNKEGKHVFYANYGFMYSGLNDGYIYAPLMQEVFKFFRDIHGLYVHSIPEFYYTGINFNWQILWYLPRKEWIAHNCNDGTFLYGDNGEYPTQEAADTAMIEKMIEIVKKKKIVNLVNSLKR